MLDKKVKLQPAAYNVHDADSDGYWKTVKARSRRFQPLNPPTSLPLIAHVAFGAKPNSGEEAPLKTTNCDLRKISP